MHRHALAGALLAAVAFATPAMANEDVLQQSANPEQWVLQTGDYANQRYTEARSNQPGQRQEPESSLDVLDRRAARP